MVRNLFAGGICDGAVPPRLLPHASIAGRRDQGRSPTALCCCVLLVTLCGVTHLWLGGAPQGDWRSRLVVQGPTNGWSNGRLLAQGVCLWLTVPAPPKLGRPLPSCVLIGGDRFHCINSDYFFIFFSFGSRTCPLPALARVHTGAADRRRPEVRADVGLPGRSEPQPAGPAAVPQQAPAARGLRPLHDAVGEGPAGSGAPLNEHWKTRDHLLPPKYCGPERTKTEGTMFRDTPFLGTRVQASHKYAGILEGIAFF